MNLNKVNFEASYGLYEQIPVCTVPEIVFSGRSNVGKSSLINKILNRKGLARVSAQPGKTRTINFFSGGSFRLVDLPGYGYAKASHSERQRWGGMINDYLTSGRDIPLLIQLIDMRHSPTKDDLQMLSFLYQMNIPYIIVLTKCDKLNKGEYKKQKDALFAETGEFGPMAIIPFSSKSGEGVQEVRKWIEHSAE